MFQTTPNFHLVRSPGAPRSDDLLHAQGSHADQVERILLRVKEERAKILSDQFMTREGKHANLRAVGERAEKEIAQLTGSQIEPLRKRAERAGAVLSEPMRHRLPQGVDPEEAKSLEREVRELIRGRDPQEVERLYLEAARKGDTVTVRAIERLPEAFRPVGEKAVQQARHLYAEARFPAEFQNMNDSASTASQVTWNANRAREALATMTGFQALPETWVSPNPTVPDEAPAA